MGRNQDLKMNTLLITAMALGYSIVETNYFGNHQMPITDAKMICDGISVLMLCLAALSVKERP